MGKTRMFGGERFRHSGYGGNKTALKRKQKYWQDNGCKTRIVPTKTGYALYVRSGRERRSKH